MNATDTYKSIAAPSYTNDGIHSTRTGFCTHIILKSKDDTSLLSAMLHNYKLLHIFGRNDEIPIVKLETITHNMIPILKQKFFWGLLGTLLVSSALVSCEDVPDITVNFNVSPKEVTIPADGGRETVKFTSPIAWKAEPSADWMHINPASGEAGEVVLTVSADANPSETERTGTVKVSVDEPEYSETFIVIQPGKPAPPTPSLTLSPKSLSAPYAGATLSVSVEANYAWSAACADDWVTLSPASGAAGTSTLNVTVAESRLTSSRSTKVVFTCESLKVELPVQQDAAPEPAYLTLGSNQTEFDAAAGRVTVQLSANYAWTAEASESWIAVSPASGDAGAQVVISVSENTVVSAREGKVVFRSEGLTAEFAVKQKGATPVLEASPTSAQLPAEGGEFRFTVTSNMAWTATAGVAWITLAPASGDGGTVSVVGTVAANDTYEVRTATVTISAGDQASVTIVVSQEAAENPVGGVGGDVNDWGDGGDVIFNQD